MSMIESTMSSDLYDDPRKLSAMVARAASLADEHEVSSALIGMAAEEGDPAFPPFPWVALARSSVVQHVLAGRRGDPPFLVPLHSASLFLFLLFFF